MRVLYVGGSGYVGGLVVPLLRERFAVRVFDLRPPDGEGEYVRGDATDHTAVLAALPPGALRCFPAGQYGIGTIDQLPAIVWGRMR
jgi:nucleoside-diphosphate-sugar epimerase